MNIISIVGKVDTRVIVYPLARALSMSGMTAIVTEDGAYRRLYFGSENTGTISGVDVIVGAKLDSTLVDIVKNTGVPYDYIITVSSCIVPSIANCVLVCKGIDKSINSSMKNNEIDESNDTNEDNNIEIPDGVPNKSIYISYESAPKDGLASVRLKDGFIRYIYECEETKELHATDDKNYIKTLSSIVAELIKIEEKELHTLLSRKEYLGIDGKAK